MTKNELIEAVTDACKDADVSRKVAGDIIDAVFETMWGKRSKRSIAFPIRISVRLRCLSGLPALAGTQEQEMRFKSRPAGRSSLILHQSSRVSFKSTSGPWVRRPLIKSGQWVWARCEQTALFAHEGRRTRYDGKATRFPSHVRYLGHRMLIVSVTDRTTVFARIAAAMQHAAFMVDENRLTAAVLRSWRNRF